MDYTFSKMLNFDFGSRLIKTAKELPKQLKSLSSMDHVINFMKIYEQLTHTAVHCQGINVTTQFELLNSRLKYYLAKL